MMDEDHRELDHLLKQMVRKAGLDSPSPNFTEEVLSRIEKLGNPRTITSYKPLISVGTWLILGILLLGLGLFAIFGTEETTTTWLTFLSLENLTLPDMSSIMNRYSIPSSLIYGMMVIMLFIYSQILRLRQPVDKGFRMN